MTTLAAVSTPVFVPVQDPWTEAVPLGVWAASTAYVVGQIVRTSAYSGNYYACTVAGTSGASAPTWLTTGATVADSGATWQYIGDGSAGTVVQRPNGMAAYTVGMQAFDNQIVATFSYLGCGNLTKASGTVFVDGAAVYYNIATGLAVTSSPTYGFYIGSARGKWGSGATSVLTMLNGPLITATWVGGALTATGAIIGQSTLAITGATTLSDTLAVTGTLTQTGIATFNAAPVIAAGLTASGSVANDFSGATGVFKTSTGTNTLGGNTLFKTIATPVAAAGAGGGVAGAAALGAGNFLFVSSDGATKGVKLLTGVAGDVKFIVNTSATACNLFAASGGTVNGGGANVGCAIPASKGVFAVCSAADTWTIFDLTAHAGATA